MKSFIKRSSAFLLFTILTVMNGALFAATAASQPLTPEVQNTYNEIKKTFGIVPSFMKNYPPEGITGAWEVMKAVQFKSDTTIPPKYKELIGLGVAAQIPCSYCIYFHTEAAKMNGATDAEIHEAIAIAGFTRYWSTFINGVQENETTFSKDINTVAQFIKQKSTTKQDGNATITHATPTNSIQDTYNDIENTLGSVPEYFKLFPESALPAAWKNMKDFVINPNTAIPSKFKELIGLGVASQIPCSYCTLAHTEFAKADGATLEQTREAILVAAGTRQWSTIINGLQTNEAAFKKETDQMLRFVMKQKGANKK